MTNRTETTKNRTKARLALKAWNRRELTWTELNRELATTGLTEAELDALAEEVGR